jgi:hypothetical protein
LVYLFELYSLCLILQLKQTTATIGASVTVSQVGSNPSSTTTPVSLSPLGGTKDWQPTATVDEDGILNQLRSALLPSRDALLVSAGVALHTTAFSLFVYSSVPINMHYELLCCC